MTTEKPNFTTPPINLFKIDSLAELNESNFETIVPETVNLVIKGLGDLGLLDDYTRHAVEGLGIVFDSDFPHVAAMIPGRKMIAFNPEKWKQDLPNMPLTQLYLAAIMFHEIIHIIQEHLVEEKFSSSIDPLNQKLFGLHEDMNDYLGGCFYGFLEREGISKKDDVRKVIEMNKSLRIKNEPDKEVVLRLLEMGDSVGIKKWRSPMGHAPGALRVLNFRKGYFDTREGENLKVPATRKMYEYVNLVVQYS